jgi:ketosteroid isomerase-like protein
MLTPLLAGAIMLAGANAIDLQHEARIIAALDTAYQAAVERNDADAMGKILHEDFVLVLGNGAVYDRDDLLASARDKHVIYEIQVEDPGTQTVRMYGPDVAIVTARLRLTGAYSTGEAIDRLLWFSDTYVRTKDGWRYAFGQASRALSDEAE